MGNRPRDGFANSRATDSAGSRFSNILLIKLPVISVGAIHEARCIRTPKSVRSPF